MTEARAQSTPPPAENGDSTPSSTEDEDALVGKTVGGRFKVVRALARGGMGKVYLAEQSALGRNVALKVLSPHYQGTADAEFHKRFMLEAAVCARLSHPNTVTIFDYGKEEDLYYIVMELLEGRNLRRAIREDGPISPERAIRITAQCCRALREAHKLNVIHRDLKPANIYLVERDGDPDFVKILDFGLVKEVAPLKGGGGLTKTGLFMGSPKYMAPEQIRRQEVDARVDVYALGVVMFQMLTGKVPFEGETDVDTLTYHLHRPIPPMSERNPGVQVPPAIEQTVRRALAKDRDDRYADMSEFLAALRAVMPLSPSSASFSGEIEVPPQEFENLTPTPSDVRLVYPEVPSVPEETVSASALPTGTERRSRAGLAIAGIIAVAAIAGGAYLGFVSESDDAAEASDADPTPPPTRSATQPPPPQELGETETNPPPRENGVESQSVTVVLRSEPSGAMVIAESGAFGPTPAEVVWTGYEARPGRVITFRFQKEGFQDYSVTRRIDGDRMEVQVTLEPLRQRRIVRPQQPTMEEGGGPLDFRHSPY